MSLTSLILVKLAINLLVAAQFCYQERWQLALMFFGFVIADLGSYWVARTLF
jgi:hypothetical protein